MKIAISGKGGVGKTLLTSLLAKIFAQSGYSVIAIDADPDANLAATLGFPDPDKITPISEMADLIEKRVLKLGRIKTHLPGRADKNTRFNGRADQTGNITGFKIIFQQDPLDAFGHVLFVTVGVYKSNIVHSAQAGLPF